MGKIRTIRIEGKDQDEIQFLAESAQREHIKKGYALISDLEGPDKMRFYNAVMEDGHYVLKKSGVDIGGPVILVFQEVDDN